MPSRWLNNRTTGPEPSDGDPRSSGQPVLTAADLGPTDRAYVQALTGSTKPDEHVVTLPSGRRLTQQNVRELNDELSRESRRRR